MLDIDWGSLFGFTVSPLELFIRGTAMFWFLFLLFRFVVRRDVGSVAMADILIFVIIADAAQNALSGDYKSITDGVVVVGTIIIWNLIADWAGYKFKLLRPLLEPPPLVMIRNGQVNQRSLRSQYMTIDELKAKLREEGVDEISEVKLAMFEANGQFSVVKKDK